jgi:hypothetical protein
MIETLGPFWIGKRGELWTEYLCLFKEGSGFSGIRLAATS